MKFKNFFTIIAMIAISSSVAFGQKRLQPAMGSIKDTMPNTKFSVSTTYLTFANFGEEKTNTHMYEFHFGYKITPKDKIGIKAATWKLFAPMGIP